LKSLLRPATVRPSQLEQEYTRQPAYATPATIYV